MRILYLHQYFTTPDMSGGTRSYEMAKRWAAAGHEIDVITTSRQERVRTAGWRVEESEGVRVHWTPIPYSNRMDHMARLRAFGRFSLLAARRAIEVGGDVVFATSTPLTIALPAIAASRRLGVPMVFEVRDLWPEVPIALGVLRGRAPIALARWLERAAYRNAARVIALSPGMAEGVQAAGFPPERVHVVPNASDRSLFAGASPETFLAQHPQLRGYPIITYAGTIGAVNGLSYMVDLAAAMARRNSPVRFLIVGEGREQTHVRRKAEEAGVLGRTLWMLPPVPKRDLPAVLAASTMASSFVVDVPELWNNSANKFFDGLAAGKPLLINHEGWQADLIRSNHCGVVAPADDPHAAAEQLSAFLADPEAVRRAGQSASALARDRFDRDRLAAELLEAIEEVVECG